MSNSHPMGSRITGSRTTGSQPAGSLKWIVVAVLALSFAACGKSADEPKRPPPPPVKDTVFGDLVAKKAKAKQQTEQAMEQHKEQLDEAMKKAEEPSPPQ